MEMKELRVEDLEQLYREHMVMDFPAAELKPLAVIQNLHREGSAKTLALLDGDKVLSYVTLIQPQPREPFGQGAHVMVDYFAVANELRGQGIGSSFLKQVSGTLPECSGLMLEIEDPEAAQSEDELVNRTRRLHFYERLGWKLVSGLWTEVCGVPYRIMVWGERGALRDARQVAEVVEQIYRKALTEKAFRDEMEIRIAGE